VFVVRAMRWDTNNNPKKNRKRGHITKHANWPRYPPRGRGRGCFRSSLTTGQSPQSRTIFGACQCLCAWLRNCERLRPKPCYEPVLASKRPPVTSTITHKPANIFCVTQEAPHATSTQRVSLCIQHSSSSRSLLCACVPHTMLAGARAVVVTYQLLNSPRGSVQLRKYWTCIVF